MTVSRSRDGIHCILWPAAPNEAAAPPFWELEDLLAQGFDRDTALALMAARRSDACLVSARPAAPAIPAPDAGSAASAIPAASGQSDRKVETAFSDESGALTKR